MNILLEYSHASSFNGFSVFNKPQCSYNLQGSSGLVDLQRAVQPSRAAQKCRNLAAIKISELSLTAEAESKRVVDMMFAMRVYF
jgi:hypothetical protein